MAQACSAGLCPTSVTGGTGFCPDHIQSAEDTHSHACRATGGRQGGKHLKLACTGHGETGWRDAGASEAIRMGSRSEPHGHLRIRLRQGRWSASRSDHGYFGSDRGAFRGSGCNATGCPSQDDAGDARGRRKDAHCVLLPARRGRRAASRAATVRAAFGSIGEGPLGRRLGLGKDSLGGSYSSSAGGRKAEHSDWPTGHHDPDAGKSLDGSSVFPGREKTRIEVPGIACRFRLMACPPGRRRRPREAQARRISEGLRMIWGKLAFA